MWHQTPKQNYFLRKVTLLTQQGMFLKGSKRHNKYQLLSHGNSKSSALPFSE